MEFFLRPRLTVWKKVPEASTDRPTLITRDIRDKLFSNQEIKYKNRNFQGTVIEFLQTALAREARQLPPSVRLSRQFVFTLSSEPIDL